jgi:hypothetical protein
MVNDSTKDVNRYQSEDNTTESIQINANVNYRNANNNYIKVHPNDLE